MKTLFLKCIACGETYQISEVDYVDGQAPSGECYHPEAFHEWIVTN